MKRNREEDLEEESSEVSRVAVLIRSLTKFDSKSPTKIKELRTKKVKQSNSNTNERTKFVLARQHMLSRESEQNTSIMKTTKEELMDEV